MLVLTFIGKDRDSGDLKRPLSSITGTLDTCILISTAMKGFLDSILASSGKERDTG